MPSSHTFDQFALVLRGSAITNVCWTDVTMLAAEELVAPQLLARLNRRQREVLPGEALSFLTEVRRRNRLRNIALLATLRDAVQAINGIGVLPVLLKGCAMWARSNSLVEVTNCERIVSDLDLLVRPCEIGDAVDALNAAGFRVVSDERHNASHPVVDLARSSDAGMIDLHARPPGPPGVPELDQLHPHCSEVAVGDVRALVPPPELQMLIAVLHDQLADGHFWHGGFNVRRLLDIAELARRTPGVDWSKLKQMCRTPLLRAATAAQLCAAQEIAGAPIPSDMVSMGGGNFHYLRHRIQLRWPALNSAFRRVGLDHRIWRALSRHASHPSPAR